MFLHTLWCQSDNKIITEIAYRVWSWVKIKSIHNLKDLSVNINNETWRTHSLTFLPMHDFSFRFGTSTYFSVIGPVALGLAWVSPEPDLPLPSLGIARDIKLSSLWSTLSFFLDQTLNIRVLYSLVLEHQRVYWCNVTCSNTREYTSVMWRARTLRKGCVRTLPTERVRIRNRQSVSLYTRQH